MFFTNKEKQAIVLMAVHMQAADGKADEKETLTNQLMFLKMQVSPNDIEAAKEMSFGDAITTLSAMTNEKKDVISAFLGALMAVDGDIDDNEMALWKFVSAMCSFPKMNVVDAIVKFKQFIA